MSIGKKLKGVATSIGKQVKKVGTSIGKAVKSKKFKTGLKVAGAVALAAGALYAGKKYKEKHQKKIDEVSEAAGDVAAVLGHVKGGVKRAKSTKAAIAQAVSPDYTREQMAPAQKKAGAALAELSKTIEAPTISDVKDAVNFVKGDKSKEWSFVQSKAKKEKEKVIKEIVERKKKLIEAESTPALTRISNAIQGIQPTLPDIEKKKSPVDEIVDDQGDTILSRLFGWFTPQPDFDYYD